MFKKKKKPVDELSERMAEIEAEKLYRRYLNRAIYVIKPGALKSDVTYKVVPLADKLYFCRVGGQFYDIDKEIAANEYLTEAELLADKNSFAVPFTDIHHVQIDTKKNVHTGKIDNSGSLILAGADRNTFIIHSINSCAQVEQFFEDYTNFPVSVLQGEHQERTGTAEQSKIDAFSQSAEQEPEKVRKAFKLCNALNGVSVLYVFWALFFPKPIELVVAAGVLLPLIGYGILIKYREIVKFDKKRGDNSPSVANAVIAPSSALFLVALLRYRVIYTSSIFFAVLILTIVMSALLLMLSKTHVRQKSVLFLIPLFILAYSYGAVITTNCAFDFKDPQEKLAYVNERKIDDSQYTLTVTLAGGSKTVTVYVDESFYNTTRVNDKVILYIKPGLWGLEWVL